MNEPATWTPPTSRHCLKSKRRGFTLTVTLNMRAYLTDENYNRRIRGRDMRNAYRRGASYRRWHDRRIWQCIEAALA